MEENKLEIEFVSPYPAPEPWMFDHRGNIIGIWRTEELSIEEMRRRYPDARESNGKR